MLGHEMRRATCGRGAQVKKRTERPTEVAYLYGVLTGTNIHRPARFGEAVAVAPYACRSVQREDGRRPGFAP